MEAFLQGLVPVFFVMGLGYASRRVGLFDALAAQALGRFAYCIAIPALLFVFTARSPVSAAFHWPFLAALVGGSLATSTLAALVARRRGAQAQTAVMHAFLSGFPNTAYLGIPLFISFYGEDGALPAISGTVASNLIMIGGATLALEACRGEGFAIDRTMNSLVGIARSPILVAVLAGVAFSLSGVSLSPIVGRTVDFVAQATAPVALFALGMSIVGRMRHAQLGSVVWLSALKLGLHPLITYIIAVHLLALQNPWTEYAVLLAALPTGAVTFIYAQQYGVDETQAGAVIATTSFGSLGSVFLAILLL